MATEQVTTNDMKKEISSDVGASTEDQPQPQTTKVDVDIHADGAIASGSGMTLTPKEEANGLTGGSSEDKPSSDAEQNTATVVRTSFDHVRDFYVSVSQPTSHESLCTRIRREIEDWPDEEDLLPPVVDFSVEQMTPGWYQSLCASPHCHGDL